MIVIVAGLGKAACMWHVGVGPLGVWTTVRTRIFETPLFNLYRCRQVIKATNVLHIFPGPTGRTFFSSIYFSLSVSYSVEVSWIGLLWLSYLGTWPQTGRKKTVGLWWAVWLLYFALGKVGGHSSAIIIIIIVNYYLLSIRHHHIIKEKEQFLLTDSLYAISWHTN